MAGTEKSERLLNLLIMLLVQRRPLPKHRIREALYPDLSDDAFEKKFERDKEELRGIGVPVEVGSADAYFDDDAGYRVRPEELELPAVDLTAEEGAVLGLASRVWEHATLAEAAGQALRKLAAAGVPLDREAVDLTGVRLDAHEASFDTFWEATESGTRVRFDYRARVAQEPETRRLEPWGVVRWSGRWYAVGRDPDREESRVFRLSRVVGPAVPDSAPGAVAVPAGTDVGAMVRRAAPPEPEGQVTLLVRRGAGALLRRRAVSVTEEVAGPDEQTPWDRVVVDAREATAETVLSFGADVLVEDPPELRSTVVERLRAVAGAGA